MIRLAVSMVPVAIAAYFIFGFNLLDLGLPLVAFFAVLVLTSWSLGLISAGVILRYGLGAEELAWSLAFLLLPICCVYYPVSVLPDWLQPVALALPPTHVFEGMRSILLHNTFDADRAVVGAGAERRLSAGGLCDVQPVPCERAGQRHAAAAWVNRCAAASSPSSSPASSSERWEARPRSSSPGARRVRASRPAARR